MCVNNLPKVVTWKQNGRESNWRNSDTLTTTSPGHTHTCRLELRSATGESSIRDGDFFLCGGRYWRRANECPALDFGRRISADYFAAGWARLASILLRRLSAVQAAAAAAATVAAATQGCSVRCISRESTPIKRQLNASSTT